MPGPRRRPDVWVVAAFALAVVQTALRLIPEARPGLAGVYCWNAGLDLVPVATGGLAVVGLIVSLSHRPFWRTWRGAGFLALAGLAASPTAFTVYPSSHDGHPSAVRFRLPLDGPVTVDSGGPTAPGNRHAAASERRWAYDLTVRRDGRTHKGDGKALDDYYAYGLPVLAPATGVVVETYEGDPDVAPGEPRVGTAAGNFIVIEVAPTEYLWLGHLQAGSITVTTGDHVAEGQAIAQVGQSGDAPEPILHVHLQDSNDPDFSEAVPLEFHHYTAGGRAVDHGSPTPAGPAVENVPPPPAFESTPAPSRRDKPDPG